MAMKHWVLCVGVAASFSQSSRADEVTTQTALSACVDKSIIDYSQLGLTLVDTADMVVAKCRPQLQAAVDAVAGHLDGEGKAIAMQAALKSFRDAVRVRIAERSEKPGP